MTASRRLLSGVAIIGVVLASCGSGSGSAASVPVIESARGEPGTPMRDGLIVQDGTVLVGTAIPTAVAGIVDGVPVVDAGWWALLFMGGNPRDVMESYLRHAEDLGFTRDDLRSDPEFLREDLRADEQRATTCGVPAEGSRGWQCSSTAFRDGGAPCVHFELVRRKANGTVESFLLVRYIASPTGCVPGTSGLIGNPAAEPPALPAKWPTLPATGAELDASWGLLAGLHIEAGSAVATMPFGGSGCGVSALLEIDGDSLPVLDAYLAQFEQRTGPGQQPAPLVTKVDSHTEVRQDSRAQGGGGDLYTAVLVRYDDGPDYLALGACSG